MKKIALALVVVSSAALAGCTTVERDAATGALAGGAIGAITTGTAGGTLAGAAIGGAAGILIGQATRTGYCIYRDPHTRRTYEARCR